MEFGAYDAPCKEGCEACKEQGGEIMSGFDTPPVFDRVDPKADKVRKIITEEFDTFSPDPAIDKMVMRIMAEVVNA